MYSPVFYLWLHTFNAILKVKQTSCDGGSLLQPQTGPVYFLLREHYSQVGSARDCVHQRKCKEGENAKHALFNDRYTSLSCAGSFVFIPVLLS